MSVRRTVAAALWAFVAITGGVMFVSRAGDDAAARLASGWAGSEGHPGCVYESETGTVEAQISLTGTAPHGTAVAVQVTAYADENTSDPVGSSTRTVTVGGTVNTVVFVAFAVTRPPQVGEDDVAACSQKMSYPSR